MPESEGPVIKWSRRPIADMMPTEARPTVTAVGKLRLDDVLGYGKTGSIDPRLYTKVAEILGQVSLGDVDISNLEVVVHPSVDADALKFHGWRVEAPTNLDTEKFDVVSEGTPNQPPQTGENGQLRLKDKATGRELTIGVEDIHSVKPMSQYQMRVFLGVAPAPET